jgi:hypothetical protein
MPQDFARLVKARLKTLDWTPYRLAQECKGSITPPTVYSFLDGKPVKSDTLAVIFDAVGLTVIVKETR